MYDSSSPLGVGLEGQQLATQALAVELYQYLADAPPEYVGLHYTSQYVGGFSQSSIMGFRADESEGWRGIRSPERPLDKLSDQLRQAMYTEGGGTWFRATVSVTREDKASMKFNYDEEPDFGREVPAHLYVADQRLFPRDVKNIPAWLAEKHAEGEKNPPPYSA